MRKKYRKNSSIYILDKYFPLLIFAGICAVLCLFMLLRTNQILDADIASELVLSRILANENTLITNNWFYSTELRVLNTQIIYSTVFKFFDNWSIV